MTGILNVYILILKEKEVSTMISTSTGRIRLTVLTILVVLLLAHPVLAKKDKGTKETFSAFAAVTGPFHSGTTMVYITVTGFTADAEREMLIRRFAEKGQKALTSALRKQKDLGFVRVTGPVASRSGSPSQRLRYAREFRTEQGRVIVLALDRPIAFFESWRGTRSLDYDLTLITLYLDKEGKGEGTILLGAKLSLKEETKTIEIEHLGTQPIRLLTVKKKK
jgi:hypothetical protein